MKYCKNYQNVTETRSEQILVGKMAPIDLLDMGLPQTFNL